jgi:cytochrome oxidase assembly protein ShyY1
MRTLATGKWVALTLGGLLLIVAFGVLSWWQWQRAQRDQEVRPVQAWSEVFTPGQPPSTDDYGAHVTVTGTYDATHQLLVAHGRGFWVVTPLRTAEGPVVAVARADVTSADAPAVDDITPGTVTVVGYAQPFEGDPGTPSTLPPGQSDRLTESAFGSAYDLADGWVALVSQTPPAAVAAPLVPPAVGGSASAGLRLQNLSYAFQWLVFAGFVVFFWVRMLRDDLRRAADEAPPAPVEPVREVY